MTLRRHGAPLPLVVLAVLVAACAATSTPRGTPRTEGPGPVSPSFRAPSITPSPERGALDDFAPTGQTELARVLRVVDGDTIVVDRGRGEERLRYIGVDTPETVDPRQPVQWMGHEASEANRSLVESRDVTLERDVSDRDRFDRLLRYVWLREGDAWILVNLELVRLGFARVVTYPPDVRYADRYLEAQEDAREAGRGLWGDPPDDVEGGAAP